MDVLICLATVIAAYLLGSIPTGYLVGRARGIDIRTVGSGNIGATNAFRILGKPAGVFVLLADALKGWVSVAVVPPLVVKFVSGADWSEDSHEYLRVIGALAVVLGHVYTCWLRFKGGKGIATSAGVLAALVPLSCAISLTTWIIVCLATRYVSVASISAALVLPFATWLVGFWKPLGVHYSYTLVIITAIMSALAIYKHKGNIQRLLNGTENKIGARKSPPSQGAAT